ncbi:MAG: hypothetical protein ABH805_01350 [Candidatus Nealsonbacteria bacterium]
MAKDMLGVLIRKIVDLSLGTLNVIYDLVEKLSGEAGQEWFAELKKFLRKENCWTGVINKFLKLISGDEILSLDAVDGTETLANAKDVFNYIDSDLKNWGVDEEGPSTEKTIVDVYEMVKDATFSQMFGELNVDMRKLCLTQHQIKKFVEKHRKWLRTDGYGTFFLFESKGNFFVAFTFVTSFGELGVRVNQFEYSDVWCAELRPRVVVSQLA